VIVRPERAGDEVAVRALLVAAFGREAEADLVERLRRDGALALALVAERADEACGFVAFPKLIVEADGAPHGAVGLAPIAVAAGHRRCGIGSVLIREGHRLLEDGGYSLSFVLGDPAYYARFGYASSAAQEFECLYAGPHFMALRLNSRAPTYGSVRYPAAFASLNSGCRRFKA